MEPSGTVFKIDTFPSIHQTITNVINLLNLIAFMEKEKWDNFLSNFMSIIEDLGSYDQKISDEIKKTKIVRTFPKSFKPMTMV